jgi:MFS family permease
VSTARLYGAFPALAIPNFRRYLTGQSVSLAGTWMQMTAQAWLVLTLSDSPSALGIIVALQTLPVLVLGPYGGVIADRVDKLKAMISLQTVMGVQALVLGLLTVTGEVRLWHVGVLAALLGVNNAFENPARQSFMLELVGRDSLRTAVSLNSTMVNLARVVDPASAACSSRASAPASASSSTRRASSSSSRRSYASTAPPSTRARRSRGRRASCARGCATSAARRSSASRCS